MDGYEQNRLQSGAGLLEFARTVEILQRHLPPSPARIADVGAGPGPYSIWLAQLGHQVVARDLLPAHVEQLRSDAGDHGLLIEAEVGDARELDVADASADAVLESVEGAGAYLPDLDERWNVPAAREAVLDVARRCVDVPEILGVGAHLLLIARRPTA